jgi:hydroxypyruvate isomerase
MPKFAANLSFLFTDVPFPERFGRAAHAGFKGVEYLFPYDWPAHDVAEWLRAADLEQVLFNLPPGDWAAGERGLACLPHRQGEFAEGVERALDYAMVLDCERVHCMAGLRPAGVPEVELESTYVANLRHAADNPGRHEPGTGEINCPFLFDLLDRLGYDGWVGCEYKPLTTTEGGLGWRPR